MSRQPQAEAEFSTMGDDLIESRFSRSYIKVFLDRFDDFESRLPTRRYDIPVHFNGDFDQKSKRAIQHLVDTAFAEAEKHDLKLEYNDPEVRFFTPASWTALRQPKNHRIPTLPAARIIWEDSVPFVELIIPEKTSTSEEVIKTVRLLFSKLFGKLFFDEHGPRKRAYRRQAENETSLQFDRSEKIHFCRLMDRYPPAVLKTFDQIARSLHIKGPKARELGRNEFFKRLFQETDREDPSGLSKVLEKAFAFHLSGFKENPDSVIEILTDRLFTLMPQTHLILPYDQAKFNSLRNRKEWTLFHALDERIQVGINSIYELIDCRDYLNSVGPEPPLDFQTAQLWREALTERVRVFKKKGWAKPFLLDDAILTPRQQFERAQFPLWLWNHCIDPRSMRGQSAERTVQRLTEQYRNSVYQKIFALCLHLLNAIKTMEDAPEKTFQQSASPKIKPLFAWLEIRTSTLLDMHAGCLVGLQLASLARSESINPRQALKHFETGWSYFVSFALVHQVFLKNTSSAGTDRSQRFFRLIDRYVQARIADHASFQIAGLLIEIYKSRRFDLRQITSLLRREAEILDFYVLHLADIFGKRSDPPDRIIRRYADSILHWQDHRRQQEIQTAELEQLRD